MAIKSILLTDTEMESTVSAGRYPLRSGNMA